MMKFKQIIYSILSLLTLAATSSAVAKDMPGATPTSYGVGGSGAFNFSMPIIAPEGRGGIQPSMSLNFSSNRGAGTMGVGWSVSGLGAITRCGKSLVVDSVRTGVNHSDDDRYCLNGQRLILVAGTQGANGAEYRTFIDGFAKVVAYDDGSVNVNGGRAPTRWRAWTKGGQIFDYGAPDNQSSHSAQFKLPGTSSVHAWNLARVSDREGNFYEATYRSTDGLIDHVEYTFVSGIAKQKIDFVYEANSVDPRFRYAYGSRIDYADRLKNVDVYNNGHRIRSYTPRYEAAPISGRSRVLGITECGFDNTCLPEVTFNWETATAGYRNGSNSYSHHNIAPDDLIEYYTYDRYLGSWNTTTNRYDTESSVKEINRGTWADVNGDGELDLVIAYVTPSGSEVRKTYLRDNNKWTLNDSNWRLPRPLRSYKNNIVNTPQARFLPGVIKMGQLADVNGDGLVDVVYSYKLDTHFRQYGTGDSVETVQETWINTGNGWQKQSAWAPKDLIFDYLVNSGGGHTRTETVRGSLMDLNGDGLVDWVTSYFNYTSNANGIEVKTTWLNNGNGWTRNANYDMPDVFSYYRGIYNLPKGQFIDVNGDGLVDWITSYQASLENPTKGLWLNTGTGWSAKQPANSPYILPEVMFDNINGWNNISPVTRGRFIDVNGDGLADWVASYQRPHDNNLVKFVRLNTGKGWTNRNSGFQAPPFVHVNFRYSTFARGWPINKGGDYMDVNQDGLVDYVESFKSSANGFAVSKKAYLNTGSGWELQDASSPYTPTELRYDYSGRENAKANFGQFIDINADGASDWVTTRVGTTRQTRLKNSARLDQIDSVTTTMGVTIDPEFLPLTDSPNLYTQYPTAHNTSATVVAEADGRFVRGPMRVTASVTTPTPDPSVDRTISYQYAGLQVSRTYGSLGFHNMSTTDSVSGITSYREILQTFPYTGRTEYAHSMKGMQRLSESATQYSHTSSNRLESTQTHFVFLQETEAKQFEYDTGDGGGLARKSKVDQVTFDDYGNLETQRTRVFDGDDTLLHTTSVTNDFEYDLSAWLLGQVTSVTQVNQSAGKPAVINHSTFHYLYPYLAGQKTARLDRVHREPNNPEPGVWQVTQYLYEGAFGNVTGVETYAGSDPGNKRRDLVGYDSDYRLATKLINGLGHEDTIVYHARCDEPELVTDANGLITTLEYDGLCRVLKQSSPIAGVDSTVAYSTDAISDCDVGECQSAATFKVTTQSSGESAVVQVYNRFNQPMKTSTLGFANSTIVQLNQYNDRGQVARSTQPYFAGDTQYWTEYLYDELGRSNETRLPYDNDQGQVAKVRTRYAFDRTNQRIERITTDVKGRETAVRANALGQVTKVIDALNGDLSYHYDSQGSLSKTVDAHNNEIELQYDLLGRRVVLRDPDLGQSSYTFNAWGDLVDQTDAKNQIITMEYDELGRLKKRTVPGTPAKSGGDSVWHYDTAPFGDTGQVALGAIATVTGPNGYEQSFEYDEYGRPSKETTLIKGITFVERFGYNANGFLAERYYPNSGGDNPFGVKYNYSTQGYLESVTGIDEANGVCVEHWKANFYDALGRVDQETLGAFVTATKVFKPGQNVLERIQSITSHNQVMVQDLQYRYDAGNNLTLRHDHQGNVGIETFEYDALDRLTHHFKGTRSANTGKVEVQYDAIGNITYKSDVGAYQYVQNASNKNSHRLSSVTQGPNFDASYGTDLTQYKVSWDFDGQQFIRSLPDTHHLTFQYDSNGSVTRSGAPNEPNKEREIEWTAFDKPTRMFNRDAITGEATGALYEYGPNQQRIYKKEAKFNGIDQLASNGGGEETIYLGKQYQRITSSAGVVTHRYTIETGGHSIQIDRADNSNLDQPKYLLADNLGSTNVILNNLGEVEQRLAFDPWGLSLNAGDNSQVNSITNRGYTGHEMDDETGLINMNARVYDPYLGRFLSADPVLPDAGNMQAFNRYAYVLGNPLKYWDPTGHDNIDVGNQPNDCSYGAGCIRPEGYDYSGAEDLDELIDNLFNNDVFWSYSDETGQLEAYSEYRFSNNASELQDLLNDPDTDLGILQNALDFLNEHGDQSRHYDGLAQRFQHEISIRTGLPGVPETAGGTPPSQAQVSGARRIINNAVNSFSMQGTLGSLNAFGGAGTGVQTVGILGAKGLGLAALLFRPVTKGLASVPGRVQSRINLSNKGLEHTLARHLNPAKAGNKSQFSLSQSELISLLGAKSTIQAPARALETGNFARTITTNRTVGNLAGKMGGKSTNMFTVISDKFGNLQTAFPGGL